MSEQPHTPPSPEPAEDAPAAHTEPRVLQVGARRLAPRYRAFIGAGAVLGALLALVLTFTRPQSEYGYGAVLGYTALTFALVGGLLGGLLAIVLDRRSRPSDHD